MEQMKERGFSPRLRSKSHDKKNFDIQNKINLINSHQILQNSKNYNLEKYASPVRKTINENGKIVPKHKQSNFYI